MTLRTALAALAVAAGFSQTPPAAPVRAVAAVDLQKFAGTYFEIARYPNGFQEQCAGDVTASYAVRQDGRVDVINRCRRENGTFTEARGIAKRAGKEALDARLKVRFAPALFSFLPRVWGDYWVLGFGPDYSYSVVGEPSRTYLWILSRVPQMSDVAYRQALAIATSNGYDVSRLVTTPHGAR